MLAIVATFGVIAITYFLARLYRWRTAFRQLPGPPHHILLGHIPIFLGTVLSSPPNTHIGIIFTLIARRYNLDELFYLDLWPIADSQCVILDAQLAEQIAVKPSLPKYEPILNFLRQFLGPIGLIVADDANEWKYWRKIFHTAFATAQLNKQVPMIVDEAEILSDNLATLAQTGEKAIMMHLTSHYAMDVIGKVAMRADFNTQTGAKSRLVEALTAIPRYIIPVGNLNPWIFMNPMRRLRLSRLSSALNEQIGLLVDEEMRQGARMSKTEKSGRTLLDLAREAYDSERLSGDRSTKPGSPDSSRYFRQQAVGHMRNFLFAGSETTAAMLAYVLYCLYTHPKALAKVRAEHDSLFGTDYHKAGSVLSTEPANLQQMPYTNACIREALRLYAPAGTVRQGSDEVFIKSSKNGCQYPSTIAGYKFPLVLFSVTIHRHASNFDRPDEYDPNRFFGKEMNASIWRPFERGPRHCIGFEMALNEIKVALALIVRRFGIKPAYEKAEPAVLGERAFMELDSNAFPTEGLPVIVTLARPP